MNKLYFSLFVALSALLFPSRAYSDDIFHRSASGAMQNTMEHMGNLTNRYSHIEMDGVPFLALQAGASLQYAEFVRLRANFPGMTGFTIMGGIGKELIFKRDYRDRLCWHAGIGYYFSDSPSWVSNAEIVVAKSPCVSDLALMADVEFNWFFEKHKRLGLFVGLGVGMGELDSTPAKLLWEASLGLTFKIFRK